MKTIQIPFEVAEDRGVTIGIDIPDSVKLITYVKDEPNPVEDIQQHLMNAVENPVSGKTFSELIKNKKNVLFMIENQFRQAPAHLLLPHLVEEVKKAGGTPKIICATAKIGALNEEEVREKIGPELYDSGIEVTSNDPFNQDVYTFMGVTSRGIPLWVHNWVAEADVKITIGSTQATLWGYGGSGMVIPGTASDETIEMNHVFTLSPDCVPGNNDNHIQNDKYEALKMAGIDMGINVITDNLFRISHINAGDPVESHLESIKEYDKTYRLQFEEKADITICGSTAPTNHLFFHTSWAIVNCEPVTKEDGTILFASPCPGYQNWQGWELMDVLKEYLPPSQKNQEKVLRDFYKKQNELWAGCIWYKIYEILLKKKTKYITRDENLKFATGVGLDAFGPDDFQEEVDKLIKKYGSDCTIAFVPFGRYTVLEPKS
ncbi:MAG: DUF2088 domain-containing protein [Eubacteriaceae bacterium]|jgi:nickel-dependent lactate racemase|nr:DUF2088 domain-containing protein [Eubacteriaceae bacterium]